MQATVLLDDPAMPPLPGADAALFLDLDGTLIEIAERPDAVVVPQHLPVLLTRLSAALDGAVAIVTGRGLEVARSLSGAPPIAFAAEHGSIIDSQGLPGSAIPGTPPPPSPPPAWRDAAEAFVQAHPGMLLEEKRHGFVVHFRAVPEQGELAHAFLQGLVQGTDFQVLPAHCAAELRPRAADKGTAVAWLMRHTPFARRTPLFIGDDVTDEHGIAACRAMGGTGYRIPRDFSGPAAVHQWLTRLADRLEA
ncbi:trehalose-phosphatase [Pseudoroseomonas globiformis]|uniref:Trehalose 6-phosphate phosphatase n=1 Tax=Teichococcus globiformis TaxID=2307229 RepID=A0ABV7G6A0_9PROT